MTVETVESGRPSSLGSISQRVGQVKLKDGEGGSIQSSWLPPSPPSLLLLILNGFVSVDFLRTHPVVRALADEQLQSFRQAVSSHRGIIIHTEDLRSLDQTLQWAALPDEDRTRFLPDITERLQIFREMCEANGINKVLESLEERQKAGGSSDLGSTTAGCGGSADENLRTTALLWRRLSSRSSAAAATTVRGTDYFCRIHPVYESRVRRYRLLKAKTDALRAEKIKREQISIQQLALTSLTAAANSAVSAAGLKLFHNGASTGILQPPLSAQHRLKLSTSGGPTSYIRTRNSGNGNGGGGSSYFSHSNNGGWRHVGAAFSSNKDNGGNISAIVSSSTSVGGGGFF